MPILLSRTYETITDESAENGDVSESGFDWQDIPHGFRETVERLRDLEPSQSPVTHPESCWFTEFGERDYRSGEYENFSIHFSRANSPRALHYWTLAVKAAGFEVRA